MENWKSNKKKVKSRSGAWENDRNSSQQTSTVVDQLPPNQNQHNFSKVSASSDNHSCSSSVAGEQFFVGGSGSVPPFLIMAQSFDFITPSNGHWNNRMTGQQPKKCYFSEPVFAEDVIAFTELSTAAYSFANPNNVYANHDAISAAAV